MANDRTFYACQAVAIAVQEPNSQGQYTTPGTGDYKFLHGVQSVGLNTNFDFENVFELGQLEIYDSVLQIPQIEITVEKVLDNYPTIYSLVGKNQDLLEDSKNRLCVKFAIYNDTENAGESTPLHTVYCTGMYINSVSYQFPVDGNLTESVTLVGNHKEWNTDTLNIPSVIADGQSNTVDEPLGGSVLTRKDITAMTLPQGSGKVQSVNISLDLGREDLLQLGQNAPYARVPNYPVEVTAEIEYLVDQNTLETGTAFDENTDELPIKDQTISVEAGDYTIDLGNKCFLKSVTYGGGDASGGNATVQYSYSTYNTFNVTGPQSDAP
jgi:hypothetical protein